MNKKKIAIIGAGASGMMAAIFAASAGAEVIIFDKNDRVGKKILATGNGKCNFSNLHMNAECYRSNDLTKVTNVISRFSPQDCVNFFKEKGMLIKDRDGYLYPASEQASTVLDLLRMQMTFLKVNVVTECEIYDVKPDKKTGKSGYVLYGVYKGEKKNFNADRVIISTGSKAGISTKGSKNDFYDVLRNMGLAVTTVVPALVQLRCREDYMKSIAGVRVESEITLYIDGKEACREYGEVQLTDYGVSGIPVFQLSRYVSYALAEKKNVSITINVLPYFSEKEFIKFCNNRQIQDGNQTAEEYFLGICNKKLLMLFMKLAGIKPTELIINVSDKSKNKMFKYLREFTVTPVATNPFEQAQVCAGGLVMSEVDDNLQLKKYPGIYVTGEVLDVDGRCGGYNLQWAFASGKIAGENASKE